MKRRSDKEIPVDHILQLQEADDSVDMQAINQIGDKNCYEDSFHAVDIPIRDITSSDNPILNHVWNKGSDGGLALAILKNLWNFLIISYAISIAG